jgi:cytochrome c oxidase assembly protein subunit 15
MKDARQVSDLSTPYRPGPHWIAVFAAVFTWPLIFVGGLVTTYRVGMAVPDWPTTFGMNMFLFRFWNAALGVFIEHGHRLYGSAVGFATIILCLWFLAFERRGYLKVLGVVALLAVIGQGILGGYRVRLNSTTLAAIHGCTAQVFFALMVTLCVLTGRSWCEQPPRTLDPARIRLRSVATLLVLGVQIVAGAGLRHFGSTLALVTHATLSVLVVVAAANAAWTIESRRNELHVFVASARAMSALIMAQVALGIAGWWLLRPFDGVPRFVTTAQALVRTGHQANGALLLAASVVLALRSFHRFVPAQGWSMTSGSPSASNLKWEAVA